MLLKKWHIYCDDCAQKQVIGEDWMTLLQMLEFVIKQGWTREGKKGEQHFCPACSEKRKGGYNDTKRSSQPSLER